MERLKAIYGHRLWIENRALISELEKDRRFCRHTAEHFLDVARLAYIENLEKGLGISKELIYAAALLHDIGRAWQYRDGISHEQAGADLAREILKDCAFAPKEQEAILEAILGHRRKETAVCDDLAGLIYRADKASRLCLFCLAEPECSWEPEKKNMTVKN